MSEGLDYIKVAVPPSNIPLPNCQINIITFCLKVKRNDAYVTYFAISFFSFQQSKACFLYPNNSIVLGYPLFPFFVGARCHGYINFSSLFKISFIFALFPKDSLGKNATSTFFRGSNKYPPSSFRRGRNIMLVSVSALS